jgi:hypothetical protein
MFENIVSKQWKVLASEALSGKIKVSFFEFWVLFEELLKETNELFGAISHICKI